MGIMPGVFIFYSHTKINKKKFPFINLYFGDMFLNGISFYFYKKPRNVHFDLNSVFLLSYKISFADLRSLFMERITCILTLRICIQGSPKQKNVTTPTLFTHLLLKSRVSSDSRYFVLKYH